MIQHVYERATACPELSEVYVATDDERIAACVRGFGGNAIITGSGHRSGTDRISEAALKLGFEAEDLVINIQGDQPLFHPSVVTALLTALLEDHTLPMATLKFRMTDEDEIRNPNHVKVVTDNQGFALYFSRYPIPFCRDEKLTHGHFKHLGFYGFRSAFLAKFPRLSEGMLEASEKLEQLRVLEHGYKIKVMEAPFNSLEVDVPEDLRKVEEALRASSSPLLS